jgi:hypothetical protein
MTGKKTGAVINSLVASGYPGMIKACFQPNFGGKIAPQSQLITTSMVQVFINLSATPRH